MASIVEVSASAGRLDKTFLDGESVVLLVAEAARAAKLREAGTRADVVELERELDVSLQRLAAMEIAVADSQRDAELAEQWLLDVRHRVESFVSELAAGDYESGFGPRRAAGSRF